MYILSESCYGCSRCNGLCPAYVPAICNNNAGVASAETTTIKGSVFLVGSDYFLGQCMEWSEPRTKNPEPETTKWCVHSTPDTAYVLYTLR